MDLLIVSLAAVIERPESRPPAWLDASTSKGNRHRTSDEDRRANPTREGIGEKDEGLGSQEREEQRNKRKGKKKILPPIHHTTFMQQYKINKTGYAHATLCESFNGQQNYVLRTEKHLNKGYKNRHR